MARPGIDNTRRGTSPPALIYVQVTSIHAALHTIDSATNASPIVVHTTGAHGFSTGDLVRITDVGGNTAANGEWTVTVVDPDHFSLLGSTGSGAYTSGGKAQLAQPVRVKCLKWNRTPSGGGPPDYEVFGTEIPIGSVATARKISIGNRVFILRREDSHRWEISSGAITHQQLALIVSVPNSGTTPHYTSPYDETFLLPTGLPQLIEVGVVLLTADGVGAGYSVDRPAGTESVADLTIIAVDVRKEGNPKVGDVVLIWTSDGENVTPGEDGWADGAWTGRHAIFTDALNPTDYLRGLDTFDLGLPQIPFHDEGSTDIVWTDASDFGSVGPTGPPGATGPPGSGDTVAKGYCISETGFGTVTIIHDAITAAAGVRATGIATGEMQLWGHPSGAAVAADAQWFTIVGWNPLLFQRIVNNVGHLEALIGGDKVLVRGISLGWNYTNPIGQIRDIQLLAGTLPASVSHGPGSTLAIVNIIKQPSFPGDVVYGIRNDSLNQWEWLRPEERLMIRGNPVAAVLKGDETFEIDHVQALANGIDPRVSKGSDQETVLIYNVLGLTYPDPNTIEQSDQPPRVVHAAWNGNTGHWEVMPDKGVDGKDGASGTFVCQFISDAAATSPGSLAAGTATVYSVGKGGVLTQLGTRTVFNPFTCKLPAANAQYPCAKTYPHDTRPGSTETPENDQFTITGPDLLPVLNALTGAGSATLLGYADGASAIPTNIQWLGKHQC